MVIYNSAGIYIASKTTALEKIRAIDDIIAALLITAADAAGKDNIEEYQLNDGQTTIRTRYKNGASIMSSIKGFEDLKTYYQNQINGSMVRLVDQSNFNRSRNGNR
jgi:hypothetical protein